MLEQSASRLITTLGEKGYHDTAIAVLDQLARDEAVSDSFRGKIPLWRANERVASIRETSDADERKRAYEGAISDFNGILKGHQDLSIAAEAAFQLGMVFLDMGRLSRNQAVAVGKDINKAQQFFVSAVDIFVGPRSGQTALSAIEKELQQVEGFIGEYRDRRLIAPDDRRELNQLEQDRERLRGRRVQVQLLAAEAFSEMAECFQHDSKEWGQSLEEALRRYHAVYLSTPTRSAGLWARLEEGKTLLALGRIKEGQEVLLEITKLPSSETLIYQLRVKAVDTLLASWINTTSLKDDEQFDERLRQFVLGDSPVSPLDSDYLAMQYRSAELLWRRQEALPAESKDARKSLLADVRILARDVAQAGGVHASSARKLLEQLGRQDAALAERLGRSFEVSFRRADEVLEHYRQNPSETQRSVALAELQDVLRIAPGQPTEDQELKREQLALLRYQLALLFYEDQRYHEAVSLGDFLVKYSSYDPICQKAAVLALASWQALVVQQNARWSDSATTQIGELASAIMQRWPRARCSIDAADVSISLALRNGDSAAIESVLRIFNGDGIGRADVFLRGGVALWHLCQNPAAGQNRSSSGPKTGCVQHARHALDEGLAAIDEAKSMQDRTFEVAVAGAVARCEIALYSGKDDSLDLFSLLNHAGYGPWYVLQDSSTDLPPSIYEPSLRVCIRGFSELRQYGLARQAMQALVESISSNQEAKLRLVGTSISVGKKLIEAAEERRDRNNVSSEKNRFSVEEIEFIEQVLDFTREATDQLEVMSWVAITLSRLGLPDGGLVSGVPEEKRKVFLLQAAATIEEILLHGELSQSAMTPWRRELVAVRSSLGQWEEAIGQMRIILANQQNNRSPVLQQYAADLFQKAANDSQSLEQARVYYRSAIVGSRAVLEAGESVIWGWGSLASRVSKAAFGPREGVAGKMQEIYFEARFRLAACRLAWAQKEVDIATKARLLKEAESDIKIEAQLHPGLGGDKSRKRFEGLLEVIQQEFLTVSRTR
jgi:tetratricopeptide (TPR) repeat protein